MEKFFIYTSRKGEAFKFPLSDHEIINKYIDLLIQKLSTKQKRKLTPEEIKLVTATVDLVDKDTELADCVFDMYQDDLYSMFEAEAQEWYSDEWEKDEARWYDRNRL